MTKPNEHGAYEPQITEELARRGRSYARVKIAQCDDGLYRYALDMAYSYGGFCGPITKHGAGYATAEAAKSTATEKLLRQFPEAWPTEPQSVHDELRELKAQIERASREPMLF
jgi:hypothetical protein